MIDQPKQCVLLCGGKGNRLLPFTSSMPKPMIPCNGRPFLWHLLNQVNEQGINEYQIERQKYHKAEVDFSALRAAGLQTVDGKQIEIASNIEFLEEIELIQKYGAKGVGLYRTEYFYMDGNRLPSEEELFENYRYMVGQVNPEPATIRTLDVGGDKLVPHFDLGGGMDSLMGLGSIRLCLKYPDIFMT